MGATLARSGCVPCVSAHEKDSNGAVIEQTSAQWMEQDRYEVVGDGDKGMVRGWSREYVESRGQPYQGFYFHFNIEKVDYRTYQDRISVSTVRQKELKSSEQWYKGDDYIIHGNGRLGELDGWAEPYFTARGHEWFGFAHHWYEEKITLSEYKERRRQCKTGPKVKTSDEWASEDYLEIRGPGMWRINAQNIFGWTKVGANVDPFAMWLMIHKAGMHGRNKVFKNFNYHWHEEEIPFSEYSARRAVSKPVPKEVKSSKQWQFEDLFRIIGEGESATLLPGWTEEYLSSKGVQWKGFNFHWAEERVTHDEYIDRRNQCNVQPKIRRTSEEWFEFEIKHGRISGMPSQMEMAGWSEEVFLDRGRPWVSFDHHFYEEEITNDEFQTRKKIGARLVDPRLSGQGRRSEAEIRFRLSEGYR